MPSPPLPTRARVGRARAGRVGFSRAVAGCAASALAVLALAGCVESESPTGAGYFETPAASTEPGKGTVTAAPKVPTSTKDVDVELAGSDDVSVVKEFGALGHPGVDSFELSFTKPITGYTLRYVDELTQDPSGEPVKLQGGALLQLVVRGATTDDTPYIAEGAKPTVFQQSLDFKPRMIAINEVRQTGDYEATLSLGIGVAKKLPFRVTLAENPTRLVVDIKQP